MASKLKLNEITTLAEKSLEDPVFFTRVFLPRWFSLPMPWVHRGLLAILSRQTDFLLNFGEEEWAHGKGNWTEAGLDKVVRHFVWRENPADPRCPAKPIFTVQRDSRGKPSAIDMFVSNKMLFIMPRGVSKTTLLNAHNLREIARNEQPFMVYLSEAAPHSEAQLQNIKRELEGNELFCAVFGNKKPSGQDVGKWRQYEIETNDVICVARGRGAQIRGLNINGRRPTDIIFDDVEDKESVKTQDQRTKALEWMVGDVEQALPQIGNKRDLRARLIGLGTILHAEAMLPTLAKNPEWLTVTFGAIDPDGEPLWEHYMTKEQYSTKRRSFIRVGKLHIFNMEYQSTTRIEDEQAKFSPRFFKYAQLNRKDFPGVAIICDPAIDEKKESDFCAFAIVGMSEQGRVHIFEIFMQQGMTPREQVDKYFELAFKWDCNKHGVETIAYQRALMFLLKEEMFRRGKSMGPRAYFEIEPIKSHRVSKDLRIEGILSPRYHAGYITHQHVFADYEEQLLDFPNGKKDGPDAVSMAVQLLDPYAAFAFDPENEDPDKLAKDQFKPLEEELGQDWRMAP